MLQRNADTMQLSNVRCRRVHSRHRHTVSRSYGGPGRPGDGRLIIPGQQQRQQGGSGRLILPGQDRGRPQMPGQNRGPPQMPPGQANFPELGAEDAGGPPQTATIRNFRPPTGASSAPTVSSLRR